MKVCFLLALCIIYLNASSQNYAVDGIKDQLKQNSDAVERFELLKVKINSDGNINIQHKWAITILNPAGDKYSTYSSTYDKFYSAPDVTGTLYDFKGKIIKQVKRKDIIDHAAGDEVSMVSDTRVKVHNFYCSQYPYTVEYEEEQNCKGDYFLPHWFPLNGQRFSVQESKFEVETPPDYNLRFKEMNLNDHVKKEVGKNIVYTWAIKDVMAIESEMYAPAITNYIPSVTIAPSNFQWGMFTGNMDSWANLGKFNLLLNKDRDQLPEDCKKEVHRLTDQLTSDAEKTKVLYNYLQENTRYIGIQLGIGGWQPLDATYVSKMKYGDCKALSNYMVALLKEAGIKAKYTLVNGGINPQIDPLFPTPDFNHVIVCVPLKNDSLWLECTSQTESAGYMGTFTGNRKALLIDEDGGHLVTTPHYGKKENITYRKIIGSIDENGNLSAEIKVQYSGIKQELSHQLLHEANKEEKQKYLNNSLQLPTYSVDNFEYKETKNIIPTIDEYIKLSSPNYAIITGKRLFLMPNISNHKIHSLPNVAKRNYPIFLENEFTDVDSVVINLPIGYETESLPQDTHLVTKFGNYDATLKKHDGSIELVRKFSQNEGTFPATDFTAFSAFYDVISKSDKSRLVLVKK